MVSGWVKAQARLAWGWARLQNCPTGTLVCAVTLYHRQGSRRARMVPQSITGVSSVPQNQTLPMALLSPAHDPPQVQVRFWLLSPVRLEGAGGSLGRPLTAHVPPDHQQRPPPVRQHRVQGLRHLLLQGEGESGDLRRPCPTHTPSPGPVLHPQAPTPELTRTPDLAPLSRFHPPVPVGEGLGAAPFMSLHEAQSLCHMVYVGVPEVPEP